jgi:hypothetical protein
MSPISMQSLAGAGGVPQDVGNLFGIVTDALRIPPFYASSIFGLPWSHIPPFHRYSEFKIIDLWRPGRTLKFLADTAIPSIPRTPPPFGPPLLTDFFWQPTVILQRPDHNGNYTTFPEEAWFFVNGIMTNDSVAQINTAYIAYLFHRPVTLIQNSTDSLLVDLLECAVGKDSYRKTESATKAFPPIYDALRDRNKHRVVVIAHSQGTIIMAIVLRFLMDLVERPAVARATGILEAPRYAPPEFVYPDQGPLLREEFEPLAEEELAKLEIYCFANCANTMTRLERPGRPPIPWIENFGNEFDIVARLGMLAPDPAGWGIDIDGPCYERKGAWGHLLNEHYLSAIEARQKVGRKRGGVGTADPYRPVAGTYEGESPVPRLFDYINGGTPPDTA